MNNYQKNVNQEIKTWEKLNTPSMEKKVVKIRPSRTSVREAHIGQGAYPRRSQFLVSAGWQWVVPNPASEIVYHHHLKEMMANDG